MERTGIPSNQMNLDFNMNHHESRIKVLHEEIKRLKTIIKAQKVKIKLLQKKERKNYTRMKR